MRGICPICEKITNIEAITRDEVIEIRGKGIKVPISLFHCSECNGEFDDPSIENGPVEIAYREYRKHRGLLQPEEIRGFRQKYGLSQADLGKLLGFGGATISRYENGALQDDAHDKTLRLAMDPQNLKELIERNPSAISSKKRKSISDNLGADHLIKWNILNALGEYPADEYSGFTKFNYSKFYNVVLLFCTNGTFTTLLNKLLFYSDFLHYKLFSRSITGLKYAHMPFGPAPDDFRFYFALLEKDYAVEIEEVENKGFSGEKYHTAVPYDLNGFEESELRCLFFVKDKFEKMEAKQISELSHEESAYKETKNGEIISYSFADALSLVL